MENLRDRIVKHFPDNRISNFPHDDTVTYKDEMDSHVHSAAVHANISIVVTVKSDGVVFLPFVETSSVMASGTGTCLVL